MKINERKLIEFVRKNDILFNKKYRSRKWSAIRENKWLELGMQLNTTADAVRKRWKTLRDKYIREKKWLSSHGTAAELQPTWKYFNALHFIQECRGHIETTTNYTSQETDEEFVEIKLERPEVNGTTDLHAEDSPLSPGGRSTVSPGSSISSQRSGSEKKFLWNSRKRMVRESQLLRNLCTEMTSLIAAAKDSFTTITPTRAFFNSMAMIVEESNLPQSSLCRLREKVMKIVHEQIELG